ncbi:MAG: hypothetical protein GY711_21880 [bacterium]|nr:hypothetical protein [bacterium]
MNDIRRIEGDHELRLDLPAAHSAGRMARQMIKQFALAESIPETEVTTIEFVTGELVDNAVDHGGGSAAREVSDLANNVRMVVEFGLEGTCWTVRVHDQGGGDLDEVRELIEPNDGFPDLEDERGRGFFLLAQMVDTLSVHKSEDGLGLAIEASKQYDSVD